MPGWTTFQELVREEFAESIEEGRDPAAVNALRSDFEEAGTDEDQLRDVWNRILSIPIRDDYPFNEPSELAWIRDLRAPATQRAYEIPKDKEWLFDRMYGAWLGRCSGCALGKPVEGFMGAHNGISSKDRIKKYLTAISPSEYPLKDYFPQTSPAVDVTGKTWCKPSTREHIKFMESDDDIRYTVIGQIVMAQHGKHFTSRDVAQAWMRHLPYSQVCTAETQAYRNMVARYGFHCGDKETIDWHWVATFENPYREWIGAQIRADHWGYGAPGQPELAADFAWRDARISHVKNGIYGEMFIAAMIAAAFALNDPRRIVLAGLAEIPKTSRLYIEMIQVIDICSRHGNDFAKFEAILDDIYKLLGHYHAVHTNNNAALVVAALLVGGHDFEKVITLAVMGGWDSDCNGATAGSIVGAMLGAKKLPARWINPLNDTLNAEVIGYHPIAISECAKKSVEIATK